MDGSPSAKVHIKVVDNQSIYVPRSGTTVAGRGPRDLEVVFGTHAGRWSSLDARLAETAGLGPGSYVSRGFFRSDKESFSRRGTGGMASRDSRFAVKRKDLYQGPGPGAYATVDANGRTLAPGAAAIRASTTNGPKLGVYTSTFGRVGHQPLDQITQTGTDAKLGPGAYDVKGDPLVHSNPPVISSSFNSTSARLADHTKASDGPGPGQYRAKVVAIATVGEYPHTNFKEGVGHANESPDRRKVPKSAVVGSPRSARNVQVKDLSTLPPAEAARRFQQSAPSILATTGLGGKSEDTGPAPGAYSQDVPLVHTQDQGVSRRGTASFVPPKTTRRKPLTEEDTKMPGPGQYNTHLAKVAFRQDLGGARSSFVSHSVRIQTSLTGIPGPAYYYPPRSPPGKKSFHWNSNVPEQEQMRNAFVV